MMRTLFISVVCAVALPVMQVVAQNEGHSRNTNVYSKGSKQVRGSGSMTTDKRALTGFTAISASGSADVEVTQGDYSVTVFGEDNIVPHLITEVEAGVLKIRTESGFNYSTSRELTVKVSLPAVKSIRMAGSGDVKTGGKIKADRLELSVSGSGDFDVDLVTDELETIISGSGNFSLSGTTNKLISRITGSGDLRAFDLKSSDAQVRISGSGNADVFADAHLDAEVTGSGDIAYRGSPKTVNLNARGSGSIRKRE